MPGPAKSLTWGRGKHGQLGQGAKLDVVKPTEIDRLKGIELKQASCSHFHTAVIDAKDGNVYTWGRGTLGLLGHDSEEDKLQPTLVEALKDKKVKKISAGAYHTAATLESGEMYTWGWGYEDRDDGKEEGYEAAPCIVGSLRSVQVRDVATGFYMTAAITTTGDLYTWGRGAAGQLGHGNVKDMTEPNLVKALKGVWQVACGKNFMTVLLVDGTVYSCGASEHGQLGLGEGLEASVNSPTQIKALEGVTSVASGDHHTACLAGTGTLYTWGNGQFSRLGHADQQDCWTPKVVEDKLLAGKTVVAVDCNMYSTFCITENGKVFLWGARSQQQVPPAPLKDFSAEATLVAAGGFHAFLYTGKKYVDKVDKALAEKQGLYGAVIDPSDAVGDELLAPLDPNADPNEVKRQLTQLQDKLKNAEKMAKKLEGELEKMHFARADLSEEEHKLQTQLGSAGLNLDLGPVPHLSKGVAWVDNSEYQRIQAEDVMELRVFGFRMSYAVTQEHLGPTPRGEVKSGGD